MSPSTFAQNVYAWPTQNAGVVATAANVEANYPSLAGKLNPNYLYATVALKVAAPAASSVAAILTIDFSNSAIN